MSPKTQCNINDNERIRANLARFYSTVNQRPHQRLHNVRMRISVASYERDSIVDRAVELIDPDLRPVPPQPNCPQSMQIYHNHRQLASEYVKIKNQLERLREYKASLERALLDEEEEDEEDNDKEDEEAKGHSAEFANQEEVENYVRKKSERDSLLQFQDKLVKQLRLLKSTMSGETPQTAPSTDDNEWVIVNQ